MFIKNVLIFAFFSIKQRRKLLMTYCETSTTEPWLRKFNSLFAGTTLLASYLPWKKERKTIFFSVYLFVRDHSYITYLLFLDPSPPLSKHAFSNENKQTLAFFDHPLPPTTAYVIYEWSQIEVIQFLNFRQIDQGS